jgi:dihydrofolate synthase / folylpolyglutamate synthase
MRYEDAIKFIYNLELFGIKMGLDNITRFLDHLGNPQNSFKTIHVAGTNGKGSVSSLMFSVLCRAGYKTGVFTSPHLVDFRERFRTNAGNIDKRSLAAFVAENRQFIIDARITFFEISTALALWYFRKVGVDIAVIEVGLGGRLDATNVIRPRVSVITHIDFDHTKNLGPTLDKIAREKAGIIKAGVPLVTGEKRPELLTLFQEVCAERGTKLYRATKLKREFEYTRSGMSFAYHRRGAPAEKLESSLAGAHQIDNIGIVLKCVELLNRDGVSISDRAVRLGLKHCPWPARFQRVANKPTIVLDAAHNADGTRALVATFKKAFPGKQALLLCGFLERPDHDVIMQEYSAIVRRAVLTKPDSTRAAEIEGVIWAAVGAGIDFDVKLKISDAVDRVLKLAGKDDVVVMSGSHYTLGEAIKRLHELRDRGKLKLLTADITLMNG